MPALTYGGSTSNNLADVIRRLPDRELGRPTRSTVPLFEYWQSPHDRSAELLHSLGFTSPEHRFISFEYPVYLPLARTKPSMTDVMILTDEVTVAVEAKWTEPRYKTAKVWMNAGRDPEHRDTVLDHWLSVIRPFASEFLIPDVVGEVVYQMIHRTASACATSLRPALVPRPTIVLYQCFSDVAHPHSETEADLRRLINTINPRNGLRFFIQRVGIRPTLAWERLRAATEGRRPIEVAPLLRASLVLGDLFEFAPTPPKELTFVAGAEANRRHVETLEKVIERAREENW